jgi:hypothetical protein
MSCTHAVYVTHSLIKRVVRARGPGRDGAPTGLRLINVTPPASARS